MVKPALLYYSLLHSFLVITQNPSQRQWLLYMVVLVMFPPIQCSLAKKRGFGKQSKNHSKKVNSIWQMEAPALKRCELQSIF